MHRPCELLFSILERSWRPPFTLLRSHAVSTGFGGIRSRFFSTRTPNSQNHSYVHYSLSKFTSEWSTNHSNRIHRFNPIPRTVATTGQIRCPLHLWERNRGRFRKKRGRVLEKVVLVRRTGGGPLLEKGGAGFLRRWEGFCVSL